MHLQQPRSTLFPYTTLFRSREIAEIVDDEQVVGIVVEIGRQPLPLRVVQRSKFGNQGTVDRKSTRLNSSHVSISYAVFCLKKKTKLRYQPRSCNYPVTNRLY